MSFNSEHQEQIESVIEPMIMRKHGRLDSTDIKSSSGDDGENLNNCDILSAPDGIGYVKEGKTIESMEEDLTESTSVSISEKIRKHFIGTYSDAPLYLQDNEYIHWGYRINFSSFKKSVKSLFVVHNEFVNIWSHLLGALFFFGIIAYIIQNLTGISVIDQNNGMPLSVSDLARIYIDETFQPIYSALPDYNELSKSYLKYQSEFDEKKVNITHTTLQYFDQISMEFEKAKDKVNNLCVDNRCEQTFEAISGRFVLIQSYINEKLKSATNNIHEIFSVSDGIKAKVDHLKDFIQNTMDSSGDYEWIDIFTYFDTEKSFDDRTLVNKVSRFPIVVFLFTAALCMCMSSILHLFCCMSEKVCNFLLRLDYSGICILMFGSAIVPYSYGFYCQSFWAYFYIISFGSVCLAVFVISQFDFLYTHKYRKLKVLMYAGLGVTSALPTIHLFYNHVNRHEIPGALEFDPLVVTWIVLEGLLYLSGVAIYALRYPEKAFPGKCDILGHSHQIWHACVIAGCLAHYFASLGIFYDRTRIACPAN